LKAEAFKNDNSNVFTLPSADGANKVINGWIKNAGIEKYITWSCARLSFQFCSRIEM
jgi:hypothetical protein